jgi:phosphocarrier protein
VQAGSDRVLAASIGSSIKLDASGGDAEQALTALQALFDDKFGEGQ